MNKILAISEHPSEPSDFIESEDTQAIAAFIRAMTRAMRRINRLSPEAQINGQIEYVAGQTLLGWIQPIDDGAWVFVPCVPQQHWSTNQQCWVDLETIRAENSAPPVDAA